MRWLVAFFASITIGIIAFSVFATPALPDTPVFDFSFSTSPSKAQEKEEYPMCRETERKDDCPSSVLSGGGIYRKVFDEPFPESFERELEGKLSGCLHYEGAPDYKSFGFRDRMTPLSEPLSDDEVAFVFSKIVSSRTSAVPLSGKLEEISFVNEGGLLTARAVLSFSFSELANAYSIPFLPSSATIVLRAVFDIKNAVISADYDQIELECESFSVPKALLIFGCTIAFGKKDYGKLFGEALENVFVNAGIYGESIARAREK